MSDEENYNNTLGGMLNENELKRFVQALGGNHRIPLDMFSRLARPEQTVYINSLRHQDGYKLADMFSDVLSGSRSSRQPTLEEIEGKILLPYLEVMRTGLPSTLQEPQRPVGPSPALRRAKST